MLLQAKHISLAYGNETVLHPFTLEINLKERLAVIGETGSGKTTLLRCLAGLTDLSDGLVLYEGQPVKGPSQTLLPGHPRIAYLSQSVHLRNHYRVKDLLERYSIQEKEQDWALARLCRVDDLMERMTDQLSGGEKQRIALAIELSKHPTFLLLDEPFSNLDIGHRQTLRSVLDELHTVKGLTIVIVSHQPAEILGWADRILVMRKGRCVQLGSPLDIYNRPTDGYVAQLLGPYNELPDAFGGPLRILRPEQLEITTADAGDWRGVIRKREFDGPSTLYSIECKDSFLLVRDSHSGLPIGKEVGIFEKINSKT